jgi:hypothetical protein
MSQPAVKSTQIYKIVLGCRARVNVERASIPVTFDTCDLVTRLLITTRNFLVTPEKQLRAENDATHFDDDIT